MSQQETLKARREKLEELIAENEKHLHHLRMQEAEFGAHTPPHVKIRIEKIEIELGSLQTELERIKEEENVSITLSLKTSRALIAGAPAGRVQTPPEQPVDAWGVASAKSRLHALSEIVAQDAMKEAVIGAEEYPHDALTMLVPLVVDLRWSRGYKSGLTRLLKVPPPQQYLRDFHCEEVSPPCPVMDGLLSAEQDGLDRALIRLANHPAVLVSNLAPTNLELVIDSINNWGRLGVPSVGGLSLLERIGEIPLRSETEDFSELAAALYRNREALIPLVARLGMPGEELLLPEEEEFPPVGKPLLEDTLQESGSLESQRQAQLERSDQKGFKAEVFLASRAVRRQTGQQRSSQQDLQKMLNQLMAKDPEKARQLIQALQSKKPGTK